MTNDPDQLVTITTATSEFTAHILIAILEAFGPNKNVSIIPTEIPIRKTDGLSF